MNHFAATALSLSMAISGSAGAETPESEERVKSVSPALAKFQRDTLQGDLWQRPALSPRDRSVITVAAVIARNQAALMTEQFNLALDHGVTAAELSEIITHLAFYTGWGNAMAAVAAAREVYQQRGISAAELPAAEPQRLPLDEVAEGLRVSAVENAVGSEQFPGLVAYTTDVLFHDLWLRPALAPRDRSLVTVSALVANGQVAQITFHLNKAMDNGLTQQQASEVMAHLAFYVGWPNAMSAVPVAKEVFAKRSSASSVTR
ncbi:carboxymuconolactone decarboxylase family protein [Serratia proteamaculans]|uniref:carboxymuconolactone decarboxylase family protein n=1 Tax=Serratia proteamaculans TaxID=28151 RepID=UPI0039B0C31C